MNIKPIPKKLLIHTIKLESASNDDGWGSEHGSPQTIKYVRVEPAKSLRVGGTNNDTIANNIVFIDAVNSSPFIKPKEKDIIEFNLDKRTVIKVKELYDDSKLHHLEVELQ